MRIIERQMNNAINQEVDWKKDNTQVINIEGVSFVYLYDNLIAMIADKWLELFDGGYKTQTTKSRLNAILKEHGNGARIFQQNFKWVVIDADNNAPIPFTDGMRLN